MSGSHLKDGLSLNNFVFRAFRVHLNALAHNLCENPLEYKAEIFDGGGIIIIIR